MKTTSPQSEQVPAVLETTAKKPKPVQPYVPASLRRKLGPLNPVFDLPIKLRLNLFRAARDGHHDDVLCLILEENRVTGITPLQVTDYYQQEAQARCQRRQARAAQEARALMNVVEKCAAPFSEATLAALDQEIFRQISDGESEPGSIAKLGALFLKVQGNLRADEMHRLRAEKLRRELQGQIDHALERLAEEVDRHPGTRGAFDALRLELATSLAQVEEEEA